VEDPIHLLGLKKVARAVSMRGMTGSGDGVHVLTPIHLLGPKKALQGPKLGTYSDWGLSSVLVINKHLSHVLTPIHLLGPKKVSRAVDVIDVY